MAKILVVENFVGGNSGGWEFWWLKAFGGFLAVDGFGGFVLIYLREDAKLPNLGIPVVEYFGCGELWWLKTIRWFPEFANLVLSNHKQFPNRQLHKKFGQKLKQTKDWKERSN